MPRSAHLSLPLSLSLSHTPRSASRRRRRACKEFSLAAKITKALRPPADADGGALRPGWAGKLGDYSGGSWAAFDASDAAAKEKALAKFIVALDAPDRDGMFNQLLGWARAGDALLDGGGEGHLLAKSDADALAREIGRIADATDGAAYAEIKARLTGFAAQVATAAEALPESL